jgi:ParB family chromosome partitioning protein
MGHARALINVDTIDKQLYIFHETIERKLSVRQTEELVRKLYKSGTEKKTDASKEPALPPVYKKLQDNLASHFTTKVKLNHNKKGDGSITIEYYNLSDLNKILDLIGVSAN